MRPFATAIMVCSAPNLVSFLFTMLLISAFGSPAPVDSLFLSLPESAGEEDCFPSGKPLLRRGVGDDHPASHSALWDVGGPSYHVHRPEAPWHRFQSLKLQELQKISPVVAAELRLHGAHERLLALRRNPLGQAAELAAQNDERQAQHELQTAKQRHWQPPPQGALPDSPEERAWAMSADPYQLAWHKLEQLREPPGVGRRQRQAETAYSSLVRVKDRIIQRAEENARAKMREEGTGRSPGPARPTREQHGGRKRQREPDPHNEPGPAQLHGHARSGDEEFQTQKTAGGLLVVKKTPAVKPDQRQPAGSPKAGQVASSAKMLLGEGSPRASPIRNPTPGGEHSRTTPPSTTGPPMQLASPQGPPRSGKDRTASGERRAASPPRFPDPHGGHQSPPEHTRQLGTESPAKSAARSKSRESAGDVAHHPVVDDSWMYQADFTHDMKELGKGH